MKTIWKCIISIFLICQLSVVFVGCQDDVVVKTPGEITGEKIMELVSSHAIPPQCYIWNLSDSFFTFEIEGQFLQVKGKENKSYNLTFNLNELLYFQIDGNYFWFTFKE